MNGFRDLTTQETDDYNEFIDGIDGPFKIGMASFKASEILKKLDPIAYYVGMRDWEDATY